MTFTGPYAQQNINASNDASVVGLNLMAKRDDIQDIQEACKMAYKTLCDLKVSASGQFMSRTSQHTSRHY